MHDAAGHDHVEDGVLELLDGGKRHPAGADERHPHTTDRAGERQAGDLSRCRGSVDRQHIVEIVGIQAQDGDHDLDLVAQAGDERRAQRPVDQPAGEDRVGGRTSLATEERAGDPTRGVHPLLDVDGERKEVEMLLGNLAGGGRRQQHGFVVEVRHDGAGSLLGQSAGFEPDGSGAEAPVVDCGGCFEHAFVDFSDRHSSVQPFCRIRMFGVVSVNSPNGYGRRSKRPGQKCSSPAATTEDRPIREPRWETQERNARVCAIRTGGVQAGTTRLANNLMLHRGHDGPALRTTGRGRPRRIQRRRPSRSISER